MLKILLSSVLFVTDVFYLFCRWTAYCSWLNEVQLQSNHLSIQSRPGSSAYFIHSFLNLFLHPSVYSLHLGDLDATIQLSWTSERSQPKFRRSRKRSWQSSANCGDVSALLSSSNRFKCVVENATCRHRVIECGTRWVRLNGWWLHFAVEQDLISVIFLGVCGLVYFEQKVHRF
jgi:hypothetical protein